MEEIGYIECSGQESLELLERLERKDGRTLSERVACYKPDLGEALLSVPKKEYRGGTLNLGGPKGTMHNYEDGPELNCVVLFGGEPFMACFKFKSSFDRVKSLVLDGSLKVRIVKVLKEERGRDGVGYRPILCKIERT